MDDSSRESAQPADDRIGLQPIDLVEDRCSTPSQDTPAPSVATYEQHKVIWLQPWCDGCEAHCYSGEGRSWCQDDAWGQCDECGAPPVKYQLAPPTGPVNLRERSNTDAAQVMLPEPSSDDGA